MTHPATGPILLRPILALLGVAGSALLLGLALEPRDSDEAGQEHARDSQRPLMISLFRPPPSDN